MNVKKRNDITRALAKSSLQTVVGWDRLESIMVLDRDDESVAFETFRVKDYRNNEVAGWKGRKTYVYEN